MELYYEDMVDSSVLSPEDICSICYDNRNERIVASAWNVAIELVERVKAEHAWITKQSVRLPSKKRQKASARIMREKRQGGIRRIVARPVTRLPARPRKLHKMRIPTGWQI